MDMVSRQMMVQQAINRKQLFMNSPWVDQVELDKSIMELDDPSLVKRLLRDPGQKAQDELEDETKTIPTLLVGIPVPAKPGQDYAGRIGVLMQYLNGAIQQGQQFSPAAQNAFMMRLDSLLQFYEQVATNEARKLRKEIQKFLEGSGLLAQQQAQIPVPPPEMAQAPV
jgi:hypothetical protein